MKPHRLPAVGSADSLRWRTATLLDARAAALPGSLVVGEPRKPLGPLAAGRVRSFGTDVLARCCLLIPDADDPMREAPFP